MIVTRLPCAAHRQPGQSFMDFAKANVAVFPQNDFWRNLDVTRNSNLSFFLVNGIDSRLFMPNTGKLLLTSFYYNKKGNRVYPSVIELFLPKQTNEVIENSKLIPHIPKTYGSQKNWQVNIILKYYKLLMHIS